MSIRDQLLEDFGGAPPAVSPSIIERVEQAHKILEECAEELSGVGTAERLQNLVESCTHMIDISLPAIREEAKQGS